VRIAFDPDKRDLTLRDRKLDFADAPEVFRGKHQTVSDDRKDYGEKRYITIGRLEGRMVVTVWTPRPRARHIISMRKANPDEQKAYKYELY
jgi:uncharacterized DUF497 family protein